MNFGSLVNIKSPSELKIEMKNRLKKQIEMFNWQFATFFRDYFLQNLYIIKCKDANSKDNW